MSTRTRTTSSILITLAVSLWVVTSFAGEAPQEATANRSAVASDSGDGAITRAEIEKLMQYESELKLNEEQKSQWRTVLARIPAPCCSSFTAATCCCSCNLAISIWGLTKHLIVNEKLEPAEVEQQVVAWIEAANSDGFRGDACFKGGCGKPFAKDGCGGMKRDSLVF